MYMEVCYKLISKAISHPSRRLRMFDSKGSSYSSNFTYSENIYNNEIVSVKVLGDHTIYLLS